MTDSWRPDWKEPGAYPVELTDNEVELTDNEWRWEFLRRCEEYQADYAYYLAETCRKLASYELDNRGFWQRYNRAEMPGCIEKYGVDFLEDPAKSNPSPSFFSGQYFYNTDSDYPGRSRANDPDHVWRIPFDLSEPLMPQLKEAERNLRGLQGFLVKEDDLEEKPRTRRRHTKKWARYLRVLDAKVAGATHQEIARVLNLQPTRKADGYDPERLVSETLAQAREVQLRFKRSL